MLPPPTLAPQRIPLSLYIHIPWCIKKCPYCDFNSHQHDAAIPEAAYLDALLKDFRADLPLAQGRKLQSIFIGGGTPSLFSAQGIKTLLDAVRSELTFADTIEITLEANPGATELEKFADFHAAGVNRLSLGVQSFNDVHLQALGRIHNTKQVRQALSAIKAAGFERWNIDLMHGLPGQTPANAQADLREAIDAGAPHISWYQLTIEANTAFYSAPPALPIEDDIAAINTAGQASLAAAQRHQYEVSAYAMQGQRSQHNLNYWQFGDYLGIGAGAHGKITSVDGIARRWKTRHPETYMKHPNKRLAGARQLDNKELPVEFMLNALRLREGFSIELFEQRTGSTLQSCNKSVDNLLQRELLEVRPGGYRCSARGQQFLDDVVAEFLPD